MLKWFRRHDWAPWGDPEAAFDLVRITVQRRACRKCNKVQLREVSAGSFGITLGTKP